MSLVTYLARAGTRDGFSLRNEVLRNKSSAQTPMCVCMCLSIFTLVASVAFECLTGGPTGEYFEKFVSRYSLSRF